MPRLNLRSKLLFSFIFVLLPMLVLLLYNHRVESKRRADAILSDQMQTAQAVAGLVDATFDEALALEWALTNDPVVRTFDPAQLDPHFQRLAPSYPQYESISVFDTAGNNVGSSLAFPPETPRVNISDRPYFQQLLSTGEPQISEILISRRTQLPTIVVIVPLKDDLGQTIGAVGITLHLAALSGRLEAVTLRPEQAILLVDRTGIAAFSTAAPDLPWEQRDLSGFEPVKSALEGRAVQERHFTSPLLGGPRLGAFTPTPRYGWVVGVTIAEDVALAPVREVLVDQLLGFSFVVVLSLVAVLVLSLRLVEPTEHLIAQAMSLGKGHLDRRVEVKTGDELEDLARSFNDMATELERRDEENARLARLKDEFLSVAAHELKTPVTSIKGFAPLLLKWEHENVSPRGLQALEAINRQADRINRLVSELLDVSRIQVGRLELRPTEFDLCELVEEVVARIRASTEKHELLLEKPGPVYVVADRDRIEQVLNNLLDNAIKYSPQGGIVETKVRVEDGEVVVSVRDHGIGIPKEHQPHIFERFFRAHTATPYEFGGMGIGLHISRETILRHGGRMWFESEEGKGSIFYFSLPIAR